MKESIYLKCQCQSSMLECQYDDEFGDFNVTMWQRGRNSILSWANRIRWAFSILKTGCPWADDVILNKDDAQKLAKYIAKNANIDCFHDL